MPFTVIMPKLSPTMEEGIIAKWHKKEGDFVKADELLLEITTDKATIEYHALDEGWLRKILLLNGSIGLVNQPIAIFTEIKDESIEGFSPNPSPDLNEKKEEKKEQTILSSPITSHAIQQPIFIPEPPLKKVLKPITKKNSVSPLARRLAEEHHLDLTTVKGSGPYGRITSKDLKMAQPIGLVNFKTQELPSLPAGSYEEKALTPMRKIIGERLQKSKSFIPHFYVKQIINAEPIVILRKQLKKLNLNMTFNDIIIKSCALALSKHMEINTGFNTVNATLIQFKTIDISVAVAVKEGLITPIIRHANYKNLQEISVEMQMLAEKAQKNQLKEEEYKGGSFTLSNLGMCGITEFTAILNPPQGAILAVGAIEDRAVVKDGSVVAGKTLSLTLSVDHRVIDGQPAADFMKTLQFLLENPIAILI
ncbi:MAG: dihydrolipoamide acetyltransferase family protein [Chlamydiales bacterium]